MPAANRPKPSLNQLERIREIHRLIRRFSSQPDNDSLRVTDTSLAEALGVCARQIMRDRGTLERLIDERDVERGQGGMESTLHFDKKLRSWRYTRDVDLSIWMGRLADEELGALLVAQQSLAVFTGMPLARHISRIFDEDAGGLVGNKGSALRADVTKLVSFFPDGAGRIDQNDFAAIFRALLLQQPIVVSYQSKPSDQPVERTLNPYHLCCFNHQWRLIAHDSKTESVRVFVVTPRRMKFIRMLKRPFRRPADFDPQTILRRRVDQSVQRVVLRVARPGVHHILDRQWLSLVKADPIQDGGIEATFDVGNMGEFVRFVLAFGRDCEVVSPVALRARIIEEATAVIQRGR